MLTFQYQVPKLPTGSNKRRMPDNPTPEMLKKMKMDTSSSPGPSSSTPVNGSHKVEKSRQASVRDDEEEDAERMMEDFAPGGDADYFVEEDGEGRFFGGGLTTEQKDILNIFDSAGGEEVREDVSPKCFYVFDPFTLTSFLVGRAKHHRRSKTTFAV